MLPLLPNNSKISYKKQSKMVAEFCIFALQHLLDLIVTYHLLIIYKVHISKYTCTITRAYL